MSFSFGSTTTPAPASSFSFGGGGGGGFGSTTPGAPAPSAFSFGSSTPAPPSGGGGLFGSSSTTTTTSGGGLFGSTTGGGLFGSSAPAPGGLFGGGSTGSGGFGAPGGGLFGQPQQQQQQQPFGMMQQQQQMQMQQPRMDGKTHYSQLPEQYRRAIDQIHECIMRHKRTMLQVNSMAPKPLLVPTSQQDHSTNALSLLSPDFRSSQVNVPLNPQQQAKAPLAMDLQRLKQSAERLQHDLAQLQAAATEEKARNEVACQHSYMYGKWPIEAVAVRRGVRLTPDPRDSDDAASTDEEKKEQDAWNNPQQQQQQQQQPNNPSTTAGLFGTASGPDNAPNSSNTRQQDMQAIVREALDRSVAYVDRVERMPSPYMWQTIHDFATRLQELEEQTIQLRRRLFAGGNLLPGSSSSGESLQYATELRQLGGYGANNQDLSNVIVHDVTYIVETQRRSLFEMAQKLSALHNRLEQLVIRPYKIWEMTRGGDDVLERAALQALQREQYWNEQIQMHFLQANSGVAGSNISNATQQQQQQTQQQGQTSSFSFGASGLTNPAPAPLTGFSLGGGGGSATPAPSTGFSFAGGSTTTTTPAPSTGFSFAGVGGGGSGLTSPSPAPGLFGSTTGAAAPGLAPATGGFGSASVPPVTPKKKSGSRTSTRRR